MPWAASCLPHACSWEGWRSSPSWHSSPPRSGNDDSGLLRNSRWSACQPKCWPAEMLDEQKYFCSSRQVDDSATHQALDELDCDCGCAVLDVQDGVDFDHVERRNYPGLVDQLHQQVCLPIRESSAHGCADAGGDFGVDGIEVEREVHPVDVREAFNGASHDARRAVGVDVLHGVDPHAGLPQQALLLHIHGAQADDHDVLCPDASPRTTDPDEIGMAAPR